MGVDVASFGDALAASDGALEVTLSNPVARSYAKLSEIDDALRASEERTEWNPRRSGQAQRD